jgi:hypothetical protein
MSIHTIACIMMTHACMMMTHANCCHAAEADVLLVDNIRKMPRRESFGEDAKVPTCWNLRAQEMKTITIVPVPYMCIYLSVNIQNCVAMQHRHTHRHTQTHRQPGSIFICLSACLLLALRLSHYRIHVHTYIQCVYTRCQRVL